MGIYRRVNSRKHIDASVRAYIGGSAPCSTITPTVAGDSVRSQGEPVVITVGRGRFRAYGGLPDQG